MVIDFPMQSRVNTTRPSFLGPSLGGMCVEMAAWQSVVVLARCGAPHMRASSLLTGLAACVPPLRIVADDHQVIKMARARHLPTGGIFSKFDQATSGKIESEARQLA